MKTFGLIGKNIDYSFSRDYFKEKFLKEQILDSNYVNFDIEDITNISEIFIQNNAGYNVTIPYKESIISYLDKISPDAKKIGAVNTIKVHQNGTLEGFNTDFYGFSESLKKLLKAHHNFALILGTGGASKAVKYALIKMDIAFLVVSREPKNEEISYSSLNEALLKKTNIIINTTPIGTFPNIEECPDIPYSFLNEKHLVYDLIYNPSETLFLQKAKAQNAQICNGLEMLKLQAEKAWQIWNE